jgi:hypothetical protein
MHRLSLLLAVLALGLTASVAHAYPRVPEPAPAVAGNPADRLLAAPIEDPVYDPATHCASKPHPGVIKLQRWLKANVRGVFWGSYRCERWGKHSASLHAENRANQAGANARTSFWR